MSIAAQGSHATGHVQTDDERRNDALQLIAAYAHMTDLERGAEAYAHVDSGCPLELSTNDGQHRLLPDGVGCPLCAETYANWNPFEEGA